MKPSAALYFALFYFLNNLRQLKLYNIYINISFLHQILCRNKNFTLTYSPNHLTSFNFNVNRTHPKHKQIVRQCHCHPIRHIFICKWQKFKLYYAVVRPNYSYSKLKPINYKINYVNILTIVSCQDRIQHNSVELYKSYYAFLILACPKVMQK